MKYGTQKTYKAQVSNHIKPALGAVKLQALKPHQIQKFYNALQREKELSPKSIRNVCKCQAKNPLSIRKQKSPKQKTEKSKGLLKTMQNSRPPLLEAGCIC